ncbi:MAG: hypothetical protein VYB98_02970, partial [Actinomycetota bacterium]|nr:hypothetical protein [Actinomycetota bacterium]
LAIISTGFLTKGLDADACTNAVAIIETVGRFGTHRLKHITDLVAHTRHTWATLSTGTVDTGAAGIAVHFGIGAGVSFDTGAVVGAHASAAAAIVRFTPISTFSVYANSTIEAIHRAKTDLGLFAQAARRITGLFTRTKRRQTPIHAPIHEANLTCLAIIIGGTSSETRPVDARPSLVTIVITLANGRRRT